MTPLYKIQDLSIHFEDNLLNPIGKKRINKAVDTVNFEIYRGETLGLVTVRVVLENQRWVKH